jgi:hypothetical protein
MKSKVLACLLALVSSTALTACDPGMVEYGYVYNPKGILYKMFVDLKNNEFNDDWIMLFSGKMTCYYNSDAGIAKLKKTIGNPDTALDRFTLEQPVLVETGKNIKGYENTIGKIEKGERYRARVIRNSDGSAVITTMISCFHEYSGGANHHYCMITDLKNHVHGDPVVPVCENLK